MAKHQDLASISLHDAYHYVQSGDPGAVGAGKNWLDTTSPTLWVLKRRNAADTAWVTVGDGTGSGSALTVQEIDGTPSDVAVTLIKVSNGTLTDNGTGDVTINTKPDHSHSGSGDGGVDLISTHLVSPWVETPYMEGVEVGDFIDFYEQVAPATPSADLVRLYAKADGKLYIKDDAGVETDLSSGGGGTVEHSYVERTTDLSITATTDATAQTFISSDAVAYDGSTRVKIELFAPLLAPAASQAIVVNLYDGATDLGQLGEVVIGQSTFYAVRFLTPSNATHTYHFKVWKTSGTATAHAGAGGVATLMPAFIRITTA